MSFNKTPKSDRFQIMTAIVLMGLFATILIIIALPPDNLWNSICSVFKNSDSFATACSGLTPSSKAIDSIPQIASKIDSACLDGQELKISAVFEEPLSGIADVQVLSKGDDYFPSEQGLADSYEVSLTIPTAVDQLDLVIPVDAMPVGIQIFGNIIISDEDISSHVAYFIDVSDCATKGSLPFQPALLSTPSIHSATCLPSRHLMIAFEFEESMPGQYQVWVADIPYQLASVISQPAMLFFSGDPPPSGPIIVKLISAIDQEILFEESFISPACGVT